MSSEVFAWWFMLCVISAINVLALTYSARLLWKKQGTLPADVYASRKLQLLLSAGYVLGCAYRSAFPVFDVQRLCLFDSWLSSVVVGRSVATVAELCFVTQWALLMREMSHATNSALGRASASAVVPLIALAEVCSWYSVLTTSNIGHVIEESLWGLTAALLVASLVSIWPRCEAQVRRVLLALCLTGIAYVFFMFLVDVPMYWSRWLADESSGRPYLSLTQGLLDISSRWMVSHQWSVWKGEVVWMSLYFSVAVWMSIALVHAPVLQRSGPRTDARTTTHTRAVTHLS